MCTGTDHDCNNVTRGRKEGGCQEASRSGVPHTHLKGRPTGKDICKAMVHREGSAIKVTLQSQTWESHGKPGDETSQEATTVTQGKDQGRSTWAGAAEIKRETVQQIRGRLGNVLDLGRREWINSQVFYFSLGGKEKQSSESGGGKVFLEATLLFLLMSKLFPPDKHLHPPNHTNNSSSSSAPSPPPPFPPLPLFLFFLSFFLE